MQDFKRKPSVEVEASELSAGERESGSSYRSTVGRAAPIGATVVAGGVNFSLFSRTAAGVELLLFDREDDAEPSRIVPLDPDTN
ncbi:MAG: glycogen debranching enzyme, partial [Aureliella sp.]